MGRSMATTERIPVTDQATNLQRLKASRKKPERGDIFAMRLPDEAYIFGRVIGAQLRPPHAPMPSAYLIYIYDSRSETATPDFAELRPDRLLIAPTFINQMPWSKGYFQNIAHEAIHSADLLPQHCFWNIARRRYVDENQTPLAGETQPCGVWGLASYLLVDDLISDALGIPRAPEDL